MRFFDTFCAPYVQYVPPLVRIHLVRKIFGTILRTKGVIAVHELNLAPFSSWGRKDGSMFIVHFDKIEQIIV